MASLSDEQWAFLKDVALLIQKAEELGYKVTGGELYRPKLMQKHYVETGKSKTMKSKHRKRLAIDLNFFVKDKEGKWKLTYKKEDVEPLGDYWEQLNPANRWGGKWKFRDVPHFERNV